MRPIDGVPATSIVVTVVKSRRSWTFGLVSAKRSDTSCRRPGAASAVARPASIRARAYPRPVRRARAWRSVPAAGGVQRLLLGGHHTARLGQDLPADVLHRLHRADARDGVE